MDTKPKLIFVAEWQEPYATVPRKFVLTFYSKDSTVEMFDVKSRRTFLRRTPCNTVEISDLYVGSMINVLSRQLSLTDYGDAATKEMLGSQMERTLAMLKMEGMNKLGDILNALYESGLEVKNMKTFSLTPSQESYIQRKLSKPSAFSMFLSCGKLLAIEIRGTGAAQKWNEIRRDINMVELTYSSTDSEVAALDLNLMFSSDFPIPCNTASLQQSTCCIIKPHILREGNLGHVIEIILTKGLDITALEMVQLDMSRADEFFEVYRGIVPGYQKMIEEMASGPALVMELSGPDVTKRFREVAGPLDPEMAKLLRPGTIRATFGKDRVRNALHCTDMPEDAQLEVEYFFKLPARI